MACYQILLPFTVDLQQREADLQQREADLNQKESEIKQQVSIMQPSRNTG